MAETQIYNRDDIQRYLQHQMTPQEMHDFEKALMNDPFLADAVEGFSMGNVEVTDKHLAEIRNALTGEMQAGKVVRMPLQKTAWWKVAAAILVVAAGGVLTFSLLTKTGDKENIVQQTALPKPDSIGPAEKPLAKMENMPEKALFEKQKNAAPIIRKEKQVQPALATARRKVTLKDDYSINKEEESIALSDKNRASATTFNPPVIEPDKPAAAKQTTVDLVRLQNDLKNKITSEKDQIPESVSLYENSDRKVISPNEYFASKAADSVSPLQAAATGYYSKNIMAQRDSAADIVLSKTNQSLSEAVVTTLLERNKKPDNKLSQQITANNAEPIGGWENFEQYLNRQTDSIKANDSDNYYSKNVEIEFSINNVGQPANIKALESTDSVAIEKAVKILANGPKWKSKEKDKKVKVIIPFE